MVSLPRAFAVAAIAASFFLVAAGSAKTTSSGLEYLSPLPGATLVLPETNIILRPGGMVDAASFAEGPLLHVSGSASGPHEGRILLSDDGRTLTFQPDVPFAASETVMCRLGTGLRTDRRGLLPPEEFTFTIAGPERLAPGDSPIPGETDESPSPARPSTLADSLPEDFPHIQAAVYGTPAPGRIFLSDLHFGFSGPQIPSYLMILENDGTPFFHRKLRGAGLDFKMQPDGRLTYFDAVARAFYALNARYDVVDSFRTGNGYTTDGHDLVLLPNGHALLMSYDTQIIDMSQIVLGGRTNARVIGLILQELDLQKNVVFQWRSWDHFQITDIVNHSLTVSVVDYVHGNSIDADPEGNLILSSRHMDEVTKISRTTGEILWRLGGKNNQFTFLNDPLRFAHQHCARLLPDGHLLLFDNGNFRLPQLSRAVEYAIDEEGKTATLVWQHRLTPDVFGFAFGSVQRFENGNTLIGWGATTPSLTEVAPDGSIVSQLTFDPGVAPYRAFRYEWPPVKPAVVSVNPTTMSLADRGASIQAVLYPVASNFAVSDVILSTVRLNGTIPADTTIANRDSASVSVPNMTVRFSRTALQPMLSVGTNRLEVSGSLTTGEVFRGSAEVLVFASRLSSQAPSLQLLSAPGALPVELAAGTAGPGTNARTFAVYDVQGRLLKRWQAAGGGGRTSWDGRASDGRRVGSGVYLIRREDGPPGPALKVVVAR